jgi:hypothetical protein
MTISKQNLRAMRFNGKVASIDELAPSIEVQQPPILKREEAGLYVLVL